MPASILHTGSTSALFATCARNAFATGEQTRFLWFTHRLHRDLLLEHAAKAGIVGWLNPPFAFFSELPARFGLTARPISLLDRRALINHLTTEHAPRHGIRLPDGGDSIVHSSMLDSFFSELLPEGITPELLTEQLQNAAGDDFAHRRNAWIAETYSAYLNELVARAQYDPRQVHALIAERIEKAGLRAAVHGAQELHIYGLYSTRTRRRLLSALAAQHDVHVFVYTTSAAIEEFRPFGTTIEEIPGEATRPAIQPAPDAWREVEWIAGEVKKLIVQDGVEPHEIAIVARTGLEDTRRTLQVLRSAGVPATARVRSPLGEIGAVRAIRVLFRAAAESWSYPHLRNVLVNPYFKTGVDVRAIDRAACDARPRSLAEWRDALAAAIRLEEADATAETDPERKQSNERRIQRYRDVVRPFEALCNVLVQLDEARTLPAWIAFTRDLLEDGWFEFRRRICRPPLERSDVVRLDQRGVHHLERLLREWGSVAEAGDALSPSDWYALLRALLAGQELVLSTPGQKGVQILEAHDAALVPFRATFLLHANDGVFPRLPAAGGLFAEEERAALRAAGLPIETFESAWQRESALWQAVTAGERVTVTYRTTDPSGTPLLPSLLVPPHDETTELPRSAGLACEPLNAHQENYQAVCELGDVVRSDAQPARIPAPDPNAMRHAILQAHAEQKRGAPDRVTLIEPLNAWNGVIRDPQVLAHIDKYFGADRKWSPSQLELYAKNPFFYFVQRVLNLEEIEEADEETNALTTGGIAHDILERFYRAMAKQSLWQVAGVTQRFIDSMCETFQEREASGEWLGMPVLWQQRKRWICETLVKFIQWDYTDHIQHGDRPWDFEREIDLMLKHERMSMPFRGRIDRIDALAGGRFRVIDYKTNTVPEGKACFRDGAVLQAVLYIEALRQDGINADDAVYRSLKQCKKGATVSPGDVEYDAALEIAFAIPPRVRRGIFEANLAASAEWSSWVPDMSIVRNYAQLEKETVRAL